MNLSTIGMLDCKMLFSKFRFFSHIYFQDEDDFDFSLLNMTIVVIFEMADD